jgi:hypothetical protein
MFNRIVISILICLAFLTVSCSPQENVNPGATWDYSDLRTLSEYDDLISEGDLIAGYSRLAGSDLQLRFDLLDLPTTGTIDLYIALDTEPGGTRQLPIDGLTEIDWDTLLVLPAVGSPQAFSSKSFDESNLNTGVESQFSLREDLIPRVIRIPWQDYVLTSINQAALPISTKGFKIQAFSTEQGSPSIQDSIGPFSTSALPPQPAPVVLAFWNTFPAYTPAQSLRRWDGAHTGPFGERHGLSILLNNIKRFGVPAVLLDLRDPFALSALDHLGAISAIRELVSEKLLILPDLISGSPALPLFPSGLPDWAPGQYLQAASEISEQYGLPTSDIYYTPRQSDENIWNYTLTFGPENSPGKDTPSATSFLPLPAQIPDEFQATPDGPSITIRKQLLDNALEINRQREELPLLILGGSLVESAFADPLSAAATLSYIANHPWIKPLNGDDLRALPSRVSPQLMPGETTISTVESYSPSKVLSNLPNPGDNSQNLLIQSAWQSALSLYSPLPPEPDILPALRSNYSGQPGITLEAARWADNPAPRQDCLSDPDLDGLPECILASNNQFAIFDLEGARLIAYFYISEAGLHQIIAPTSQLIVGLSDPSTWQLDAGEGAETAGIHGAFANSPPPWEQYDVIVSDDQLTFTSPDQRITKVYSLSETGLRVEFHTSDPISAQIPVVIDPWTRFSPDWSEVYSYHPIPEGYLIQLDDQLVLEVLTDSSISAQMFTDSRGHLSIPEDPNFDYPKGHYLPFPMALLELESQGDFTVQFTLSP